MFHKLSFAFVLLVVCQYANGQQLLKGSCPIPTYLKKFNEQNYLGLWYQWARYPHVVELGQKCSTAQYGAGENNTITVLNSAITLTGKPTSIEGTAIVLGPGRLNVKFSKGAVLPQNNKENYIVVGTDYKNWAVVSSCRDLLGVHAQFCWVLTREKFPREKYLREIEKVLEANKIPLKHLHQTDQLNCPKQ